MPEVQVRYLEDIDVLQVRVGKIDGEWETLGQGLIAYHDSEGTITGFWIDGASYIMKPFIDALNEQRQGGRGRKPANADTGDRMQTAQK